MPLRSEEIKKDIKQKEEVNKIDDEHVEAEYAVAKGELEGNEGTTDKDQY